MKRQIHKIFVVSGFLKEDALQLGIPTVCFNTFSPNPRYEEVEAGVALFRREGCDGVLAIGGGSAIDVAKCVKLFSVNRGDPLTQPLQGSSVPLIAVPTTAGTGSEATRFAVVYRDGKKYSVEHESMIAELVVLDPELLDSLPLYQKKCTLLDALCQGIESLWSVNSTEESKRYARDAVALILENYRAYLADGNAQAAENVMIAANLAGKAINISKTTAPHAMSYKLTSLFRIPHGHAVALCFPAVLGYMQSHTNACIDPRGEGCFCEILSSLNGIFKTHCGKELLPAFRELLQELEIRAPECEDESVLDVLASSVNAQRLGNNPVPLSQETLRFLYHEILFTKGVTA